MASLQDMRKRLAALRRMTVENGCSPNEANNAAQAADRLAKEISKQYGAAAANESPYVGGVDRGVEFDAGFPSASAGMTAEWLDEMLRRMRRSTPPPTRPPDWTGYRARPQEPEGLRIDQARLKRAINFILGGEVGQKIDHKI